jgi:hypothetical protein
LLAVAVAEQAEILILFQAMILEILRGEAEEEAVRQLNI